MAGKQRFCPLCGQYHPAEAAFCPVTGRALPPLAPRRLSGMPLWLLVGSVGALLLVAGLWLAWFTAPAQILDWLRPDRPAATAVAPGGGPALTAAPVTDASSPETAAQPPTQEPPAQEPPTPQPFTPTRLPPTAPPAVASTGCGDPVGRIYYTCGSRVEDSEICAIWPDGSGRQQLTRYGGSSSYPAPAPDGASLAFVSNKDGGKGIYRLDLGSGQVTTLLGSNNAFGLYIGLLAYSPDGSEIAFTANDGQVELYRMNNDGGNLRAVAQTAGLYQAWLGGWSPDGGSLAFTYGEFSTNAGLGIADLNDSGYREVNEVSGINSRPDWGIDGRMLLSSSRGVAVYDPFSGSLETLVSGGENRSAAFSPNGCHAVLYRCPGGSGSGCSLFVLDLSTRALTRLEGTEDGWSPRWGP